MLHSLPVYKECRILPTSVTDKANTILLSQS